MKNNSNLLKDILGSDQERSETSEYILLPIDTSDVRSFYHIVAGWLMLQVWGLMILWSHQNKIDELIAIKFKYFMMRFFCFKQLNQELVDLDTVVAHELVRIGCGTCCFILLWLFLSFFLGFIHVSPLLKLL
mgnify:CR=1 FL=1|jgi:hypothetical protein